MYLFFDTETTGLSRNGDHVVQLAWVLSDSDGRVLDEQCHVIRPDGYSIPPSAARIHGITTLIAEECGKPIKYVLKRFNEAVALATVTVAHNISFDLGILQNDYGNSGIAFPFHGKTQVCTMKLSTTWCRLPKLNGSPGFKYPKLEELHYRLFGKAFDNAHDALADSKACMRCYFELVNLRVITPPKSKTKLSDSSRTDSADVISVIPWLNQINARNGIERFSPSGKSVPPSNKVVKSSAKPIKPPLVSVVLASNDRVEDNSKIAALQSELLERKKQAAGIEAELALLIGSKQSTDPRIRLEFLAGSHYAKDRIAVARDPKCPTELLGKLVNDEDRDVLVAVARHPNSPWPVLERLYSLASDMATWKRDEIIRCIGENPACPQSVYQNIADSDDPQARFAIVKNQSCPSQILDQLSANFYDDFGFALRLAKHSNISGNALATLFWLGDKDVANCIKQNLRFTEEVSRTFLENYLEENRDDEDCIKAIASNRFCPPDILDELAENWHETVEIALELAANPNATGKALPFLILLCGSEVGSIAKANPAYSEDLCRKFVRDYLDKNPDEVSRSIIAESKLCPPDILTELARDEADEVRISVAGNPNSPSILLVELAINDPDETEDGVRETAFENPSCPLSDAANEESDHTLLEKLASFPHPAVRATVAQNKKCHQLLLEHLRRDNAPEVRLAAMSQGTISPGEISRFADDPYPPIRKFIVQHESTSVTVLERASRDPAVSVRIAVASHNKVAQSALEILAKDESSDVREAVAKHRNTSEGTLLKLADDPDGHIRMVVARRPHLPESVFNAIAQSPFFEYRREIVLNLTCPLELLEKLANDPEPKVSQAATKRLYPHPQPTIDSIDRRVSEKGICDLMATAFDIKKNQLPKDKARFAELATQLDNALDKLPINEAQILRLYYGLNTATVSSTSQIAEILDIKQSDVSKGLAQGSFLIREVCKEAILEAIGKRKLEKYKLGPISKHLPPELIQQLHQQKAGTAPPSNEDTKQNSSIPTSQTTQPSTRKSATELGLPRKLFVDFQPCPTPKSVKP